MMPMHNTEPRKTKNLGLNNAALQCGRDWGLSTFSWCADPVAATWIHCGGCNPAEAVRKKDREAKSG